MTRGSRLVAAIFAAIFAFPAMASAFVRPGDLDTIWGGTGIFQTVIETWVRRPRPQAWR